MAKRRARERRRERRHRPAGEPRQTPPPPAAVTSAPGGVSWTGLIGGLMGIAPMLAAMFTILVDPPEVGRALAPVPLLMASIYIPAVWASVAKTERRQAVLRGSVVASLVLAFTGSFVFGFANLLALLPATVLLWLASGGLRPGAKG